MAGGGTLEIVGEAEHGKKGTKIREKYMRIDKSSQVHRSTWFLVSGIK